MNIQQIYERLNKLDWHSETIRRGYSYHIYQDSSLAPESISVSFEKITYEDKHTLEKSINTFNFYFLNENPTIFINLLEYEHYSDDILERYNEETIGFDYLISLNTTGDVINVEKKISSEANSSFQEDKTRTNQNPEVVGFIFENIQNINDIKDLFKLKYDLKDDSLIFELVEQLVFLKDNVLKEKLEDKKILSI